jgi:hypothetical protein
MSIAAADIAPALRGVPKVLWRDVKERSHVAGW